MDLGDGPGRDLLVALAVVGGILLLLFLYTGNWPPPVVVESNSMMHVDQAEYEGNTGDTRADGVPYGRIGTIDPGDLVLVKSVDEAASISTYALGDDEHYGMPGEVIIYFKDGPRPGTPIIHRAMTYIQVEGQDSVRTYHVQWSDGWTYTGEQGCQTSSDTRVCTFGSDGVTIPELDMQGKSFDESGFLTKGDNDAGNPAPDQVIGITDGLVQVDQIQGVARAELPWFGLIKLTLTGSLSSTAEVRDHPYFWTIGQMTAPKDLWIMLGAGLTFVAFAPVGLDYGIHYGRRWIDERLEEPDSPPGSKAPGSAGGPPSSPGSGGEASTPEASGPDKDDLARTPEPDDEPPDPRHG